VTQAAAPLWCAGRTAVQKPINSTSPCAGLRSRQKRLITKSGCCKASRSRDDRCAGRYRQTAVWREHWHGPKEWRPRTRPSSIAGREASAAGPKEIRPSKESVLEVTATLSCCCVRKASMQLSRPCTSHCWRHGADADGNDSWHETVRTE